MEQSWNSCYFAADVPDLQLSYSAGDVVTLKIYNSEGTTLLGSLTEEYAPDEDGNIVVRDAGKVAMAYLEPLDISGSAMERTTSRNRVRVVVEISSGGVVTDTHSTYVYYSKVRTNPTANPEAYHGFLSQYRRRTITMDTPICLSYSSQLSPRLVVTYVHGGSVLSERLTLQDTALAAGWNVTYFLTLENIASRVATATSTTVAAADILRVKAVLLQSGTECDSLIFDIDRGHQRQCTVMLFTNAFGLPETEPFTGEDSRGIDMDSEFAYMDGRYAKAWTELTDEHKVNSGYVSRERYHSLCDLAESDVVRILDGGTPGEEITITKVDLGDVRPRREPVTAVVTYRPSARTQRVFGRGLSPTVRIFDRTYDQSFE